MGQGRAGYDAGQSLVTAIVDELLYETIRDGLSNGSVGRQREYTHEEVDLTCLGVFGSLRIG